MEMAPSDALAAMKVWKDVSCLSDLEITAVSSPTSEGRQGNCTIYAYGLKTLGQAPAANCIATVASVVVTPMGSSDGTALDSDEVHWRDGTAARSGRDARGSAGDRVAPSLPDLLERQLQEYRRLAYRTRDLPMLAKFLELGRAPGACDLDRGLLVLQIRAVRMLHLCDYCSDDICLILAHASAYASAYFRKISVARRGSPLRPTEVSYMLLIFMYMAHAWIMDRNCELSEWHDYLFDEWCTIGQLNIVVLRLLMLQGGIMRLCDDEMKQRWKALLQARKGNKMEGKMQLLMNTL